ncbi:MAG: S-layer homology domain-containing protein [Eubacteriales bacterium]|nr:S-layer homology domain-containing protein [Eubacteriales bacterium]
MKTFNRTISLLLSVVLITLFLSGNVYATRPSDTVKPIINTIEVNGLMEPVVGVPVNQESPHLSINEPLAIQSIKWIDLTTGNHVKPSQTFLAGHSYRVQMEIILKKGYYFPSVANEIKAIINDKIARISRLSILGATITLDFPPLTNNLISFANINGISEPVVNAIIQTDINKLTINSHLNITEIRWKDLNTNTILKEKSAFQAGHSYQVQVDISTVRPYLLNTDQSKFYATINRKPAEVARLSEVAATIVKSYPTLTIDPTLPYNPENGSESETGSVLPGIPNIPPEEILPPVFFKDVTDKDWFYEDVQYVARRGIMKGTGNQMFRPRLPMKRNMIATMLHRLAGTPAPQDIAGYMDNLAGTWYTEALSWVSQTNIASDFTTENFFPEAELTREQMVTLLYRYAKLSQMDLTVADNLNAFSDSHQLNAYAEIPMKWAVQHDIIRGTTTHLLLPKSNITRAEIAAIFHRFMEMK